MVTAFDSLYPTPPEPSSRRKRSNSFLASVKGLVKRPSRTNLEPPANDDAGLQNPPNTNIDSQPRALLPASRSRSQSRSWGGFPRRGRRSHEHVPSMIDYLTLAQLETVWRTQDTYKSCVSAPQTERTGEMQQFMSRRTDLRDEENHDLLSADVHPALRPRGRSFDDSAWSRPPSYRP